MAAILTPANGNMFITTDLQFALSSSTIQGCKVLMIDDLDNNFYEKYGNPNLLNACILLPPYSAIDTYEGGETEKFVQMYTNHLYTICNKIISAVLRALCGGVYILLYCPSHVYKPICTLLDYLNKQYGILVGNAGNSYMYDHKYDDNNIRFMFFNGHLSANEVIMNIDINCIYSDVELRSRLIEIIEPALKFENIDIIKDYFVSYQYSMLCAGKILSPCVRLYVQEEEEE